MLLESKDDLYAKLHCISLIINAIWTYKCQQQRYFYDIYTAYVFIIHWGNLLKFVNFLLGLVADCNNITITASEYLTNPSTIVDVGGKCAKTNSDAVDGVVVYGSASEIFSNCSGEVVNNNIVLTFRFHFDDSIQIQTKADEFLIQCEVSTQTLLNSTLDYKLEHTLGLLAMLQVKATS